MGDASSSLQGAMCGLVDDGAAGGLVDVEPHPPAQPLFSPRSVDLLHRLGTPRHSPREELKPPDAKTTRSDASTAASDDESIASDPSLSSGGPRSAPVRLHIYDLGTGSAVVNRVSKELGLGVFHTGVEVYGREWCFGQWVGVGHVRPTKDPGHQYRETIEMGTTSLSEYQVMQRISQLRRDWRGHSYNLLTKNCNHFSGALLRELGAKELPEWCNSLAAKPVGIANWLSSTDAEISNWLSSTDSDFDGGAAVWEALGLPAAEGGGRRAKRQ